MQEGLSCHLNAACTALDGEGTVRDCKIQRNAHDHTEAGWGKKISSSLFFSLSIEAHLPALPLQDMVFPSPSPTFGWGKQQAQSLAGRETSVRWFVGWVPARRKRWGHREVGWICVTMPKVHQSRVGTELIAMPARHSSMQG